MTFKKFVFGIIICIILSAFIRIGLNSLIEKPIGRVQVIENEIEVEYRK